jgi:hypothetical protein
MLAIEDACCPRLRDAVWGFVAPQKLDHSIDPGLEVNINAGFFFASPALRHKYVI